MPIQIPLHSQASPGPVPNAGAQAMPRGHWPTQQAARVPLNRERATADMFSGGLQGLQSVGNLLGDVGGGFFKIAQQMRAHDDYLIKTDAMLAGAQLDQQMVELQDQYQNDPQGLIMAYDQASQNYSATVLDRDMPDSVRDELSRVVQLRVARDKTNLIAHQFESRRSQSYERLGTSIMKDVAEGNKTGVDSAIAMAVEHGVIDSAAGERMAFVEGQKAEYNRFITDADAAASNLAGIRPTEIDLDEYEITQEQRHRATLYKQQAQNRSESRLMERMIATPNDFTEEVVKDLVDRKYLSSSTANRWSASLQGAALPPDSPEVQSTWRMVNGYQPAIDGDTLEKRNEIMIEMAMLSSRAPESVKLMQGALKKRIDGYEDLLTDTLKRFEETINVMGGDTGERDTEHENEIYNRMADEVRSLTKQFPDASEEEIYNKSRIKFEIFKNKPVKEIRRLKESAADSPLISMVKEFEGFYATAYDDLAQTSIGYGTKAKAGEKTITKVEANRRLNKELESHRSRVKQMAAKYGYKFTQNEEDALTSFDYNTGAIEKLTAKGTRGKTEIAAKMLEYVKAGGKALPGLVRRRKAEANLFLGR